MKQNAGPPSLGALAIVSATSACVGFCPRARSKSPNVSRGTVPVPFLSNSANASLYSVHKKHAIFDEFGKHKRRAIREARKALCHTCVIALKSRMNPYIHNDISTSTGFRTYHDQSLLIDVVRSIWKTNDGIIKSSRRLPSRCSVTHGYQEHIYFVTTRQKKVL